MNTQNTNKTNHAPPTQRQRWFRYGLNVTVLIIATIAIVVLVNWIAYRRFVRFDFTQTRRYSLSEQTQNLLDDLDTDIQITTLYAAGSADQEMLQRVQDLLYEYERRSSHINVRQIDPTVDIDARERFIDQLLNRYGEEIARNREVLGEAKEVFADIREFAQQQTRKLPGVLTELSPEDQQTPMLLTQLHQFFLRIDTQLNLARVEEQIDELLAENLTDFQAARNLAAAPLTQLSGGILNPAIQRFTQTIEAESTPNAAQDALIGMKREYQQLADAVEAMKTKLEEVDTGEYDRLRSSILQTNSIIVTAGQPAPEAEAAGTEGGDGGEAAGAAEESEGLVILTLNEVYPNLVRSVVSQGQVRPEEGYKGEEVVTGAILRMTLDHDTKVVFVNPTPQPVLSPRGHPQASFNNVAERLRQMNFEVTEWQPGGRMGPTGRVMPPTPRPLAEEGQKMIFVVLPAPPPDPRQGANPTGSMTAAALREHLQSDQPAMVFVAPSTTMSFGPPDPLLEPLLDFGITVQTSRLILTAAPGPGETLVPTNNVVISEWPDDHPVSRAVRGLSAILLQGLPINLPAQPPQGVELWPLAVTPEDTWAEAEFARQRGQAERNESDPGGPFTVAAAAQKGDARLIVISDRAWATDYTTQFGPRNLLGNTLYVAFPANAELFVNGVYWLAGLDELIAPGARTQDIRRIDSIDRPVMLAVWWIVLLGLPVLCLGAGGVVWVIRRR